MTKRVKKDGDAGNDVAEGEDVIDRETLESLFSEWKADVTQNIQQSTEVLFKKYDNGVQKRFNKIETDVWTLRQGMQNTADDHAKMHGDIEKLERALEIAESSDAIRKSIDQERFDRDIDPTFVRINAEQEIEFQNLQKTVSEWLDKDFAGLYEVQGITAKPVKNITVSFKGPSISAAKRVEKCLGNLRNVDGTWTQLYATNERQQHVKVFEGPDKSQKQIRTETDSKRLLKCFEQVHSDKSFKCLRREGIISCRWKQIARVVPKSSGETTVEWNHTCIDEFNIFKDAMLNSFRSSSRSSVSVEWRI